MTDDELAHAWESFAVALADVPRQRENRRKEANLMRGTCLADFGVSPERHAAMQNQQMLMNAYANPYARGIQRGIFGFGIMI